MTLREGSRLFWECSEDVLVRCRGRARHLPELPEVMASSRLSGQGQIRHYDYSRLVRTRRRHRSIGWWLRDHKSAALKLRSSSIFFLTLNTSLRPLTET